MVRKLPDEELGRRVARLRGDRGWTQQDLAARLAMSRVAISHLEGGMSQASERTVALLAGVFHLEPHELVAGTSYPIAKAERLPAVVARYTEIELQLRLLDADLAWCAESPDDVRGRVIAAWRLRLDEMARAAGDIHERAQLRARLDDLRGN